MNRKKVEEYSTLLKDSAAILQSDTELWKQFLNFATQFTHYRFRDQLLIYAQNSRQLLVQHLPSGRKSDVMSGAENTVLCCLMRQEVVRD